MFLKCRSEMSISFLLLKLEASNSGMGLIVAIFQQLKQCISCSLPLNQSLLWIPDYIVATQGLVDVLISY